MEIILLHGGDKEAVHNKLTGLKQAFETSGVQEFGDGTDWQQIVVEVSSGGLFGGKRLIVWSNPKEVGMLSDLQGDADLTLVIYYIKDLPVSSTALKAAKEGKVAIFHFPQKQTLSVFPFLDLLAAKKSQAFSELEKLYLEYGDQYLLTMIFYLLRQFVLLEHKTTGLSFGEQKRLAQKSNFPLVRLNTLYRETLLTDFKIKTGSIDPKLGITRLVQLFLE